ncbi:hypothetical protein [Chelatococcus reniformis]|uniref:Apple domain-containing protein n=1 Tax=Chelatococcus reniformis TaxID=1494448 RepID=A0A916XF58_9HYPH|nr:hypothetical protein [Chelatococcus reniformis]GGC66058.1 hypothetical protein GCM10010994_25860 [Chelatococcus reniformis]
MRRALALSAALALWGAAVAPAAARPASWTQQRQAETYTQRSSAEQCERSCSSDYSPCDPLEYKLADGRCQNSTSGGR